MTATVAYDLPFYRQLPKLFPHNPGMANLYATNPQLVETTARRNSSLQGAYLILAARTLGRPGNDPGGRNATEAVENPLHGLPAV